MSRRHDIRFGDRLALQPRSLPPPLGEIWSVVTSKLGTLLAPSTPSPTAATTSSTIEPTAPTTMAITPVASTAVPVATVVVDSTILRTSLITVHLTTPISTPVPASVPAPSPPPSPSVLTSLTTFTSTGISTSVSSSAASSGQSIAPLQTTSGLSSLVPATSSAATLPTTSTVTQHTSLPVVVGSSSFSGSPTLTVSLQTHDPIATPSARADATHQASKLSQKHAIIGGLCGAIAGLLLFGILLAFYLRRRRKRGEWVSEDAAAINEKAGLRPAMIRKWTQLTGKGTPKPTPRPPFAGSPVTVDEEHHIIRMSTQHWIRPFAVGQGEGFRDSVTPGQLRVVNPDLSRPTTPRSNTAQSFLERQRTALAAVLLGANRSRASSRANRLSAGQLPEIVVDPALSRECIAPMAATPSFRSYPSVTSLPVVQQQPPEDPFITPPLESPETAEQQRPKRPSLAPLQSAAGAAGRTLSHIGSVLNPFRTKSNAAESVQTFSRHSVSTMSSRLSYRTAGRWSDPFNLHLDKSSLRGSDALQGRTANEMERGQTPNWRVYDGT